MLSILFVVFILAGTSYAAYLDLRTTEVPDSVSLIIGGGAVLFYLYHSISPPFALGDAYLIAGTLLFAAAVGTYLKLYRILGDEHVLAKKMDGRVMGRIERKDVAGTVLMVCAAAAYYLSIGLVGFQPLVLSVLSGTVLFAIGWTMYLAGMWGGADAFVLGAVGYAFPHLPPGITPAYDVILPVPASLLILVFVVGAVYSVGYALVVAFYDGEAIREFWQSLVRQRRRFLLLSAGYLVLALGIGQVVHVMRGIPFLVVVQNSVIFLVILLALLVLYQFLKVVEDHVMRQQIPVEELQPGDVLANPLEKVEGRVEAGKIVGVTPEQVELVRDHYDTVTVRTGVRFIVAFPIAIILLVLLGDPLFALSGVL